MYGLRGFFFPSALAPRVADLRFDILFVSRATLSTAACTISLVTIGGDVVGPGSACASACPGAATNAPCFIFRVAPIASSVDRVPTRRAGADASSRSDPTIEPLDTVTARARPTLFRVRARRATRSRRSSARLARRVGAAPRCVERPRVTLRSRRVRALERAFAGTSRRASQHGHGGHRARRPDAPHGDGGDAGAEDGADRDVLGVRTRQFGRFRRKFRGVRPRARGRFLVVQERQRTLARRSAVLERDRRRRGVAVAVRGEGRRGHGAREREREATLLDDAVRRRHRVGRAARRRHRVVRIELRVDPVGGAVLGDDEFGGVL